MYTEYKKCNECTVRKATIFAGLLEEELESVSRLIQPSKYKRREVIFFENDTMTHIYLVKNGIIKVYKSLRDGRQQILRLCGLGDLLGADAIFSRKYSATAQTVTESVLCKIPVKDFLDLLYKQQKLTLKLLHATSQELVYSQNQIFNLGARNARERIADFLLYAYHSQCDCDANPKKVNLPISRQEISELLGIKQETVVRILSGLKRDELIGIKGREITLINIPSLSRIAQCSEE